MDLYFYGGSFDPPHLGHKKIISYFSNRLDKLLVIPTYQSPKKLDKPESFLHRKNMLEIMLSNFKQNYEIVDFENKNKVRYTFETVEFLKNKYPEDTLNMILGLDQFNLIDSWKNHEYILSNINLSIISRPGYTLDNVSTSIKLINDIHIDISSQDIKNNINDLERIKSMLDENVFNYIIKNKLYI